MSEGSNLVSRTAKKELANNAVSSSYGLVLKSTEKENVCDIIYINSAKKMLRRANVEVEMRNKNDNWFPKPGDLIKTSESNDNNPTIVGQLVRDYARDIKPNRILEKDVLPNNISIVRGQIVD